MMGIIDFPLTDGVHEENDNKLGKPSSLISCSNFYYSLIGRLAVRGGFQGASADAVAVATYGTPRHSVEIGDDLAVVTDTHYVPYLTSGVNQVTTSKIQATGVCCEKSEDLTIPSNYGSNLTGENVLSNAADYVRAGLYEYVATGGACWVRAIAGGTGWSVAGVSPSTASDHFCCIAPHTSTTSGAGIVACNGSRAGGWIVTLAANASTVASASVATASRSAQCIPYGTGSIVAILGTGNLYLYYCNGDTITLKATWAHGLTIGNYGRVRIAATTGKLWIAIVDNTAPSIRIYSWTIPNPATGAWAATPATTATGPTVTAYSNDVFFDVTSDGYMLFESGRVSGSPGTEASATYKWDLANNAEIAWNTGISVLTSAKPRPSFVPISKLFQVPGYSGWWVFGEPCPKFEPGNGVFLVRVSFGTTDTYDGETVSVVAPYESNGSYTGSNANYNAGTPAVDSTTGEIRYVWRKCNGSKNTLVLGTWVPSSSSEAVKRSITTTGQTAVFSANPVEVAAGIESPTVCPIYVYSAAAVAGATTLDAGTYQVRLIVEVDTPEGVWQSAASIPEAVTIAATNAIGVNATVSAYPWRNTSATGRLVAFVAPPGSTTYYRCAALELEAGYQQIRTLTIVSSTALVTVIDTTAEILYELAEPPRVYPGDAVGVAWANGRLWRWRGFSLWFTHATTAGVATQWAGDTFRIDFNGEVQGVGQLQGQPVVITSDAVWLLGGDGPDRSGSGQYELRQLASVPLGCLDQRSVLETPAGLLWSSVRGIEMVPAGGGIPVSVGQPVRETYARDSFVLGAHCQARSLAIWAADSLEDTGRTNVVCFDYLRGVWFTWDVGCAGWPVMAGAWRGSFVIGDYYGTSGNARMLYDAKVPAGSFVTYPAYSLESTETGTRSISAYFETGDVRVSGSNTNAIWRGAWLLGALGRTPAGGDIVYSVNQTADGAQQATQTYVQNGTAGEVGWFRSMALFPVSDADGVSAKVSVSVIAEYGPGYATNGGPPTISALSFDYDATGNLSRLGSGNRS
jgi:hypothetical protein